MPVPKRRSSKTRTARRRHLWKVGVASTGLCPQCQSPKLSYAACSACGYYKGRKVIKSLEERKKKEEKK